MLEKLPPEVLLNVAFYLSFDNVKKCREVSKSWQAQMENYGLFNSAVIVITPENENQYWKSKLLRFVNTLRITKFKNSVSVFPKFVTLDYCYETKFVFLNILLQLYLL